MKLPPKPEPGVFSMYATQHEIETMNGDAFGADQLRAYGKACARAALEEAAQLMEPKTNRPCDCVICDCGNSGDRAFVMAWDADRARAAAIRAIEVKQ